MSVTARTDRQVPDEIQERVTDCGASNWKEPMTISVDLKAREVLQEVDGWQLVGV